MATELTGTLRVMKDTNGRYRWVAISSNAYEDRHGEIVSRKALEEVVERQDTGPLLWWHMPNIVLGEADLQVLQGNMLIESGTFVNDTVAKAFANTKEPLQISVGLAFYRNKLKNGVYESLRIVERSILPQGTAANELTAFAVVQ
jgi:hypothetical protein